MPAETPVIPSAALAAATAFVAAHGTPSRAVPERVGRAGVRIVLVGADGAMGDVLVPSEEVAAALIEQVDELEPAEWDRDTVAGTVIGSAHRRKMAARTRG